MTKLKQFFIIALTTIVLLILLEVLGLSLFFHKTGPYNSGIIYLSQQISTYLQNQRFFHFQTEPTAKGMPLNEKAWLATFQERGLHPSHDEPREGYWGSRVNPKQKSTFLRYVERHQDIPRLIHVDKEGFQYTAVPGSKPEYSILILGGSVAYGAYASTYAETYFVKLAHLLAQKEIHAEIYVLAAGAWISTDELLAFVLKGLNKSPDMVIFFDGLNDLTNIDKQYGRRTAAYLRNMEKAKTITAGYGMTIVYALQPFLPGKKKLTPLEKQILKMTKGVDGLAPYYEKMRCGLRSLEDNRQAYFVDCSKIFDQETATTFTDIWHFTDPGHQMVAEYLAEKLSGIIKHRPDQSR